MFALVLAVVILPLWTTANKSYVTPTPATRSIGHMSALLREYSDRNMSLKLEAFYPTGFDEELIKSLHWGNDKKHVFLVIVKVNPTTHEGDVGLVIFPKYLLSPYHFKAEHRAPFPAGRFGFLSHPVTPDVSFFDSSFAPYLTTQHLVAFTTFPPNPLVWHLERAETAATAERPFGVSLLPARPTVPKNTILEHKAHFATWDALARHTFFSAEAIITNSTLRIHVPLFGSVWPIRYWATGSVLLTSDSGRVEVNIGVGFMSSLISLSSGLPIELIVVPHTVKLNAVTSDTTWFQLNPPGPDPGPSYRVYLLGRGLDMNFSKHATVDICAYPEESLDYRYHLSMAHTEALRMTTKADQHDINEESYYHIAARIATSIFALSEMGRTTEYFLLDEIVDVQYQLKFLNYILMRIGAGAHPNTISGTLDLIFADPSQLHDELSLLFGQVKPANVDYFISYDEARDQLKTAYALSRGQDHVNALSLARRVIMSIYKGLLVKQNLNATERQALFFASMILLNFREGLENSSRVLDGRTTLLLMTSMCTAAHATQAALNIQEGLAYLNPSKHMFTIPNVYSPCMGSLRTDLTEEIHVMNLLSAIPTRPGLNEVLHTQLDESEIFDAAFKTMMIFTTWTAKDLHILHTHVPEVFTCQDAAARNGEYVLILPAVQGHSYVITRNKPQRGLVYSLADVDVYNPISVVYLSKDTCVSEHGVIETVALPHPDNLKECLYCGSVFLRYLTTGAIMDIIIIDSKDTERQLAAMGNSTIPPFNPDMHGDDSKAVLLFPNGTVVTLLGFERRQAIRMSGQYLGASLGGAFLAVVGFGIIGWMLCGNSRLREYNKIPLT
uniref:ORF37 n=1 Tax=Human herpesvirus 3 TaxID=10335 RepID=A0A0F7GJL7_HHV3|nr:ORF37 [Human alphaherpesvirus 3]